MMRGWIFSILLFLITGCTIDAVDETKGHSITIASTFLEANDSSLFSAFTEKTSIEVTIQKISIDSLIQLLQKNPYSSNIDLILTDNLIENWKLHRSSVLQLIGLDSLTQFDSDTYNFIGLGFNPYVFSSENDSITMPRTYNDLTRLPFKTTINSEQEIPLFAALLSRMDRVKTYNWIKKYNANKNTGVPSYSLKTYSDLSRKEEYVFPGQGVSGTIYNLTSVSIVKQTENYTNAIRFIDHFRETQPNVWFCSKLNLVPLSNPDEIRIYRTPQSELIQYYEMIRRMKQKLD